MSGGGVSLARSSFMVSVVLVFRFGAWGSLPYLVPSCLWGVLVLMPRVAGRIVGGSDVSLIVGVAGTSRLRGPLGVPGGVHGGILV